MTDGQNFTVTYKATADSYMAMFTSLTKGSALAKRTNKAAKWNFIAAFLGVAIIGFVFYLQSSGAIANIFPNQSAQNIMWFTSVFAAGCVAGIIFFTIIYLSANTGYVMAISEAFEKRNLTFTLTLDSEGLKSVSEWGVFSTIWKGVERVYESNNAVIIVATPDQGMPIPFSAFASEEDRKKFVAYVEQIIAGHKVWSGGKSRHRHPDRSVAEGNGHAPPPNIPRLGMMLGLISLNILPF